MKIALNAFALTLPLALYPAAQAINPELLSFWGTTEVDTFSWYRMLLLGTVAVISVPLYRKANWKIWAYVTLLLISFFRGQFPITELFGTPTHHEGLIALLGYVGVYLVAKEAGFSRGLERIFSAVIFISFFFCALQAHYGNFLDFPPLKALLPDMDFIAVHWPLYGLFGNPNHLGLFVSLFLPYCLVRKKRAESVCLALMLAASGNRAGFISLVLPLWLINRRYVLYLLFAAVLVAAPFQKTIFERAWQTAHEFQNPHGLGHSFGGRPHLWKMEWPLIKKDILIGDGPGTYPLLIQQDIFFGQRVVADRPHNLFLNIWQTSGLLSLSLLVWITLAIWKNSGDSSFRLGALAYSLNSLFTDSVLCVTPYFLIFLGVMAHEHNEKRRHHEGVGTMRSGSL